MKPTTMGPSSGRLSGSSVAVNADTTPTQLTSSPSGGEQPLLLPSDILTDSPDLDVPADESADPSPDLQENLKPGLVGLTLSLRLTGLLWWQQRQRRRLEFQLNPLPREPRHHPPVPPQASPTLIAGMVMLLGLAGVLWVQYRQRQPLDMIPPSSQTLSLVLQQNYEFKKERALAALEAGALPTELDQQGILRHEVQEGDTLWKLTRMYQMDAAAIAVSNGMTAQTPLEAGQILDIPSQDGIIIRVQPGDTLEGIAQRYGVSQAAIIRATILSNANWLQIGQKLLIPGDVAELLAIQKGASPLASPAAAGEPEPLSPQPSAPTQPRVHTVAQGDTIEGIASRYGVSQQEIIRTNRLRNSHWLSLGQELRIPALTTPPPPPQPQPGPDQDQSTSHTVRPGDTIEALAWRYQVSQQAIIEANQLSNPHWLRLGQELHIPTIGEEPQPLPTTPPEAFPHTITAGETIEAIAIRYRVPQSQILAANPEVNPNRLGIGQDLLIPGSRPQPVARTVPSSSPTAAPAPPPAAPAPNVTASLSPTVAPTEGLPSPPVEALPDPVPQPRPTLDLPPVELPPPVPSSPPQPTRQAAAEPSLPVPAPRPTLNLPPVDPPVTAEAPATVTSPPAAPASSGFVWPVSGQITSGFGWRSGRIHAGVDIPGPSGSPIVAVMEGKVIFAGFGRDGYGNRIDIRHPNGLVTRYAHGQQIYVQVGQWVQQGQTIMTRGSTGWSTGPHLHFEVRPDGGAAVDPRPYLAR